MAAVVGAVVVVAAVVGAVVVVCSSCRCWL